MGDLGGNKGTELWLASMERSWEEGALGQAASPTCDLGGEPFSSPWVFFTVYLSLGGLRTHV